MIPKCNVYWVKELSNLANLPGGLKLWLPATKTTRREWLSTTRKPSIVLLFLSFTVNAIAQYSVFSTIDLRSAYHQVSIKENDTPYMAFQAGDALYQFTRIPFGVTNGVAYFQRIMADLITSEKLQGTFAYLDNVKEEHDENLKRVQNVATQ